MQINTIKSLLTTQIQALFFIQHNTYIVFTSHYYLFDTMHDLHAYSFYDPVLLLRAKMNP